MLPRAYVAVLMTAGSLLAASLPGAAGAAATTQGVAAPVLAAAGDIACSPGDATFNGGLGTSKRCQQKATSDLVLANAPTAVAALGDNQYDAATATEFAGSYDRTWGRFKSITHPTPGNHEYWSPGATGYFDYFGAQAGGRTTGYYSYDLGTWHIVVLNANCGQVGGCAAGSAQERWLKADLAAHPASCTLAYWHQPRFSSARQGDNAALADFWSDLYAAHAEIVLNGHHHHYERFAPMSPAGTADAAGVREFIVGTGGEDVQAFGTPKAASQVRLRAFGVLFLTLGSGAYSWRFASDTGGATLDAGSDVCH